MLGDLFRGFHAPEETNKYHAEDIGPEGDPPFNSHIVIHCEPNEAAGQKPAPIQVLHWPCLHLQIV